MLQTHHKKKTKKKDKKKAVETESEGNVVTLAEEQLEDTTPRVLKPSVEAQSGEVSKEEHNAEREEKQEKPKEANIKEESEDLEPKSTASNNLTSVKPAASESKAQDVETEPQVKEEKSASASKASGKQAEVETPNEAPSASADEKTVYLYVSMSTGGRGAMSNFNRASTILKSYNIDFIPVEITMDETAKRLWKYQGIAKNKKLPAVVRDREIKLDFDALIEANEFEEVEELIFDDI
ncbi:hypothetical protein B9G98_00949 [Wickerhamiella sorbophila]|uniref:Glutaredoxin domain-containing protein n=1 Tax=Wickerhamiella sorbophila TaxID=45607 RepID=A0A2T0FEE8_9ASCO|nr:hypothetical protein B9G98_00949 [Wickerhamiella sorbophila]PRT53329.1 hypothetical protein B9G98_00949 [Wickerhamiella sorbophila]